MILGSHVSFGNTQLLGSINEALSYNANALMFYTGAPQNTIRKSIDLELLDKAKCVALENNFDLDNIICHAPYIINLANNIDLEKWDFSINFLINEIKRCNTLGCSKIVLHPGSAVSLDRQTALNNIIDALKIILKNDFNITILLETMAGKGTECGKTIDELKYIIDNVKSDKLGICIDTCHINDAGYSVSDFDKYLDEIDEKIGIDKIGCIHLNDSKNIQGAHKDRHENIGFGTIGFTNLYNVLNNKRIENVPKILETPYVDVGLKEKIPPYKMEIEMLKKGIFDENLFLKK